MSPLAALLIVLAVGAIQAIDKALTSGVAGPTWPVWSRAILSCVLGGVLGILTGVGECAPLSWTCAQTAIMAACAGTGPVLIRLIIAAIFPSALGTATKLATVRQKAKMVAIVTGALCFVVLTAGCAQSLTDARNEGAPYRKAMAASAIPAAVTPNGIDCYSIDRGRLVWHGAGLAFGAAGVGGTLTALAAENGDDDKGRRTGLLIGAGIATGFAIGAEAIATGLGNEWARFCSSP